MRQKTNVKRLAEAVEVGESMPREERIARAKTSGLSDAPGHVWAAQERQRAADSEANDRLREKYEEACISRTR